MPPDRRMLGDVGIHAQDVDRCRSTNQGYGSVFLPEQFFVGRSGGERFSRVSSAAKARRISATETLDQAER
jgi:hypothetical protein